jgi:hypothetical protein
VPAYADRAADLRDAYLKHDPGLESALLIEELAARDE